MRASDPGPLLQAEHAVARILADAVALPDVAKDVLAAIGESLGWQFGAGWDVLDGELRMVDAWSDGSLGDASVAAMCMIDRMARGEGLPGRVLASGEPAWIVEVGGDRNFPRRRAAADAGLKSAFCFPVETGDGGVAGAIEFFTRDRLEPDERLLATMASLGRRMGVIVDRRLSARALHSSEATGRAIMQAALDAVVTMDDRGRVVEFNPAAERIFGYPREEVIGQDMADALIPPQLRQRHRLGLARYLDSGTPTMLDRRIEITGLRSNGEEFPVELAITRIDVPGPPLFTGHIRDITDRKRYEAELRASRARLVETADAERRRLERDLHDGAQQMLVHVALELQRARRRIDSEPDEAATLIDHAVEGLHSATAELRELAHGIHPAVLTDQGLSAALRACAARSPVPVRIVDDVGERLRPPVEAAVYFMVSESLTNVARHAHASRAEVRVARTGETVTAEVRDDGDGGADLAAGSGLRGLADRVGALDGTLSVVSPPAGGTVVRAEIPCG